MAIGNNYITSEGLRDFKKSFLNFFKHDRPKTVEIVSWAAGNGDRSENGDYIYGKKKLRQIDSRIKFLTSVIEDADIIHPNDQINSDKIFFGAYVELCQGKSKKKLNLRIVGQHETTHDKQYISWGFSFGKTIIRSRKGRGGDCRY